jgi:hypothetical protein
LDRPRLQFDAEAPANNAKNCSEIVHGRVASLGQHAMQALGWFCRLRGEGFESHRRIHEIAQHQTRRIGLAVQEKRRGLIQQRARKFRITPNALHHCSLGVPC